MPPAYEKSKRTPSEKFEVDSNKDKRILVFMFLGKGALVLWPVSTHGKNASTALQKTVLLSLQSIRILFLWRTA